MKKGLIILPFMLTFVWPLQSKPLQPGLKPQTQATKNGSVGATLKKATSSKQSSRRYLLKKVQRIVFKTIEHPLVYGPPLVVTAGGLIIINGVMKKPDSLIFLVFPGFVLMSLVCNNKKGKMVDLRKVVGVTMPLLLAYTGGCLYALKKALNSEREKIS